MVSALLALSFCARQEPAVAPAVPTAIDVRDLPTIEVGRTIEAEIVDSGSGCGGRCATPA